MLPLHAKLVRNARSLVGELIATRGITTTHFQGWNPGLDEMLSVLPESDVLPHELFCRLMESSDPAARQIILLKYRDEPIGIAGLKQRWGAWEPVTQWIVPGVLFPMKQKYVATVLASLGVNIKVAWWRQETPPPTASWIKNVVSTPTHGIDCSEDYEHYWRKSGFFKSVRLFRNRCEGFTFGVNLPNARDWTIRNWEAKWRQKGKPETPGLTDRLLVAEYLEKKKRYHTVTLLDGETITAGIAFIIHQNTAVAQVNYRDPRYDKHGVMSRLWDLSFQWAKESGFAKVDIGGSFDYKDKLVPENGHKWEFEVLSSYTKLKGRRSATI